MFQYRGKEARIERGRECLGRDRKNNSRKGTSKRSGTGGVVSVLLF